jgi:hypothetical protein
MWVPVWWMVGSSVGTWLATSAFVEREAAIALLGGMLGPLVVAVGSWLLTANTHRQNPEAVTSVMMGAFIAKLVIVGLYVVVMLRVVSVAQVPFVAGFTSYFIGLYAMEALFLKRLFSGGSDAAR